MTSQQNSSVVEMAEIGSPRLMGWIWRFAWSGLLLATSGTALAYALLDQYGFKQSSAMFIGLPLLVGLLTINLTRTRSVYGQVLRANVIGLTIIAPLLGEGSICLLMAAPLFIGVSMIGALIYDLIRGPQVMLCLAVLPFILGVLETHTTLFVPEVETVTTTTIVRGDVAHWRSTVREAVPVAEVTSSFLNLGFPLPAAYHRSGETIELTFASGDTQVGSWAVQRVVISEGVQFLIQEDTTPIQDWIQVLDSTVTANPLPDGTTHLTQQTRFLPELYPMWYFVPLERYGFDQAHDLALASWQATPLN